MQIGMTVNRPSSELNDHDQSCLQWHAATMIALLSCTCWVSSLECCNVYSIQTMVISILMIYYQCLNTYRHITANAANIFVLYIMLIRLVFSDRTLTYCWNTATVVLKCWTNVFVSDSITSWWFQPIWKILVKFDHFPNFRGENKKCLKPPTRFSLHDTFFGGQK